ncbi:MAG: hypothetical protein NG737_03720, partial [Omnitrophica bacterium]|nr:hypothetical protein [Candidatus Omnitrophota bacterium]
MNRKVKLLLIVLGAFAASFCLLASGFTQENYTLSLKRGWNFVSLPLNLSDTDIGNVLSPIKTRLKDVWGHEPTDTNIFWKHYRPGLEEYSSLREMNAAIGYWVDVKYNTTLQITGTLVPENAILNLKQGWNVIGWPYLDSQEISEALGALTFGVDYDQVSTFNKDTKVQEDFINDPGNDDFTSFEPSKAYYIYMLKDRRIGIGVLALDSPQNLVGYPGDGRVILQWDEVTGDNMAGYNIYRSQTQAGPYSKINSGLITANSYTDNTVSNGTQYYYVVTAVDIYSLESEYSNEVSTIPQVSSGPTEVGGDITTDTTWTLAGSPYIVTSNIAVKYPSYNSSTAILTIQPGVEIRFNSGTGLTVGRYDTFMTIKNYYGAINAQGTSAAPVIFTSNAQTPSPGDWKGIYFTNATKDDLTILDHCIIEYAGDTNNANVYFDSAVPSNELMNYMVLSNSSGYGMYVSNSSFTTHYSNIFGNALGGIN